MKREEDRPNFELRHHDRSKRNRAELRFDKLQGYQVDRIYVDEAAGMPESVLAEIAQRILDVPAEDIEGAINEPR